MEIRVPRGAEQQARPGDGGLGAQALDPAAAL
jgi:hypothetical protein